MTYKLNNRVLSILTFHTILASTSQRKYFMAAATPYPAKLTLHDLELMVNLGMTEREQLHPQPIRLTIGLYLPSLPRGCAEDGNGYLCYDELCQHFHMHVATRSWQLIEYLAASLAGLLEQWLQHAADEADVQDIRYQLCLHKLHPPAEGLQGGASFTLTNLPQGMA